MQGQASQAAEYCEQALTHQPDNRHALLCRAYLLLRQGQAQPALDVLKKQRRVK